MVQNWKQFNESLTQPELIEQNEYLKIFAVKNGIKLELTPEGKEELEDQIDKIESDQPFVELFESIQGNSEMEYHIDLGEMGFGLTSAPGITDGYYHDDNGEYTDGENKDSKVYYYSNYMVKSFLMEMYNGNDVIFNEA